MRFFPWLTEEFTSPLPPAEVLRRVQQATAQPLGWRDMFKQQPDVPFRGRVGSADFDISRIIDYRNSMLPQITGWVEPGYASGSRLRLRHRLHLFTLVFAGVWLLLTGSVALTFVIGLLSVAFGAKQTGSLEAAFIPLGMFAFGLLLFTVPFWLEVNKSRPLLVELLQLTPA